MNKQEFIALLDRYAAGQASEREQQLVEAYLDRLEASGGDLPDITDAEALKQASWQWLEEQMQPDAPVVPLPQRSRFLRWVAAAAAVLLLLAGYQFWWKRAAVPEPVVAVQDQPAAPPVVNWLTIRNHSQTDTMISLPDGSALRLAAGSEASYPASFTGQREIILHGQAFFNVQANKQDPFKVVSGQLSTIALGTAFSVNANAGASKVTVRLYEGKVLVKDSLQDRHLQPGEELTWRQNGAMMVRQFRKDGSRQELAAAPAEGEPPAMPKDKEGNWYMFNNEPLAAVLDQLAQMYDTAIVYRPEELRNLYFIGKFDRSATLETILKRIAVVHGLQLAKADSTYRLRK